MYGLRKTAKYRTPGQNVWVSGSDPTDGSLLMEVLHPLTHTMLVTIECWRLAVDSVISACCACHSIFMPWSR